MFYRTKNTEPLWTTAHQELRGKFATQPAYRPISHHKPLPKKAALSKASSTISVLAGTFIAACATVSSFTHTPEPKLAVKAATAVVLPPEAAPAEKKMEITPAPNLIGKPKDITHLRPRTIYFTQHTQLAPGSMEIIKDIASQMKKSCRQLMIEGHAGVTEARPVPLSLDRAYWVADRLERHRMLKDRMVVRGLGATRPPEGMDPSDPRHMRVVVKCAL